MSSDEPSRFVQLWPSVLTGEWVMRSGVVGRRAEVVELHKDPALVDATTLLADRLAEGFVEWDEETADRLVVQWGTQGKQVDMRLIERATDLIGAELDERGLGHVDGFDRGNRLSTGAPPIVVNIFCDVVDGEKAAVAAMAALREGRADPTRATIVYRRHDQADWIIRYDRVSGKLPGGFSL